MKISVGGIYDRGNLEKERVHFRADTDLNLSFFVLLDTMWIDATQVSAGNHGAFWFAPQQIPRGHHVVVYTRAGTPNVETRPDGTVFHFVFRSLAFAQYVSPVASVVVIEAQTWVATSTETATIPPLPPTGPTIGSLFTYGTPTVGDLTPSGLAGAARLSDLLNPKR